MTTIFSFILAQDGGAPPSGGTMQFVFLFMMIIMFYFLLIRPQRVRQKALAAQIAAMKKGDKVITAGGIHGMITNVKDTTATVKVAENVKLEFQKTSITTVIPRGSEKGDADLRNQPAATDEPLQG